MPSVLQMIFNSILKGDQTQTQTYVRTALEEDLEPIVILNEGMIPAMKEVGRRFERGEFFVPEMLVAARAMQNGMAVLKPLLLLSDVKPIGKVAIGTVKGDLHSIGKNLVAMMLEGAGFEIQDLGTDVSSEEFVRVACAHEVDIIAMSALLATTVRQMAETIEALKKAGVRDQVRVIIGGAPVTAAYSRQIGADGFAPDASQAVDVAKALLQI
jgi:5-methyltetrahydrofolate--homocysteine methyltransferase